MINKNTKNTLLGTGITMALTVGAYTSINSYNNIMNVKAQELDGEVQVTVSSLWTYASPNWLDKKNVVFKGNKFKVKEIINVSGSNMYKLDSGLYITSNPKYVSFINGKSTDNSSINSKSEVYSTTENLNLRFESSTSSKILLTIPKGNNIRVISNRGSWSKVNYNGREGYVANRYIKPVSNNSAAKPDDKPNILNRLGKTTENLNLRTGASTSNRIVLTIPKGKEIKIISNQGSWSKVNYNGREGYVANKYITEIKTNIPKPETPKPGNPTTTDKKFKTNENLNLRIGSGTGYKIILTIPKGKEVIEKSRSGSWSKINYNGREGYVANRYIAEIKTNTPKPEKPKPDKKFKTNENLNLRTGSGTGYKIILTIPKGKEVIEKSRSGSWSKINYNGREGYVANKYIAETKTNTPKPEKPKPEPEKPKPEPEKPIEYLYGTTTEYLNIRSKKEVNSNVLGIIPKNVSVKILNRDKNWTEVTYGGHTGYIYSDFIIVEGEEEALPVILNIENIKKTYSKKDIKLIGHSISNSGIKDIQVILNDKVIKVNRVEREDLKKVYRDYKYLDKIGFEISIGKDNLKSGQNKLNITVISNDNSSKNNLYSFNVVDENVNPPILSIDNILNGDKLPSTNFKISGNVSSEDGIEKIVYYINGSKIGTASVKDGKFSIPFAKNQFKLGPNSIKIEAVSNNQNISSKSIILNSSSNHNFKMEKYNNSLEYYVDRESKTSPKPNYNGGVANISNIDTYMNPANFIYDETLRFMFLELSYKKGDLNVDAAKLNKILKGKGVLEGKGQNFLNAANDSNVNPFYLVAHSLLETGNGSSTLAKGQTVKDTYEKFGNESTIKKDSVSKEDKEKLFYNVFGINAYNSNANLWGAQRAYIEGWDSVEKAIEGGAKWISRDYINRSPSPQNTLYKMRYNISGNMSHEYARDIMWSYKQAKNIKKQFDAMGVNSGLNFIIPIFK